MTSKEDLMRILENAREAGCPYVEVDGVKYHTTTVQVKPTEPDLTVKDITEELPAYDDLSEEEILFWSCDYGKELEELKKLKDKVNG